jgi:hypothetical protein
MTTAGFQQSPASRYPALSFYVPSFSISLDRDAAARYVLSRRTAEGGYCFYRTPEWGVDEANAPDTLAALRSLRLLGIDPLSPEATGRWLLALQSVDGGYPTPAIGWAALQGLDLLGLGPDHSPLDWLTSWASGLLESRRPRDWRGALRNALRLVELTQLLGLEFDAGQLDALARLVDTAADGRLGRWARPGADLETTAVALRLVRLVDLPTADEETTGSFLRGCEDGALGLRLTPVSATTSGGALRGGLAIARTLNLRPRYSESIDRSIARLQRPSGGLGRRDGAIAILDDTWLGLRAASLLEQIQQGTDLGGGCRAASGSVGCG